MPFGNMTKLPNNEYLFDIPRLAGVDKFIPSTVPLSDERNKSILSSSHS